MSDATKFDGEKPRVSLVPMQAVLAVAQVMTFGADKYGPYNWKQGMDWSRLYSAAQRHQIQFWEGEDIDPESGLHHLAHAICNLMMLYEYTRICEEKDDRYKNSNR